MTERKWPLAKQPVLRIKTTFRDANRDGDIFGGWLMAQIDLAGSVLATTRTQGPVATVASQNINFLAPLRINDIVSFYAEIHRIGTTSITIDVEVYTQRLEEIGKEAETVKVADARMVYVAITEPGYKRKI